MEEAEQRQTKTKVGPAGWSYEDWKGVVYPTEKPRGFSELSYIARYFDTVEVNTTFYRPPTPWLARQWVRKVAHNPDFEFTAKLWQRFTHEGAALGTDDERKFKEGIQPLVDADRLGTLLVQFPWRFKNEPGNREWLGTLLDAFFEYPLVVEFRHASWLTDDVFNFLKERGVGFANIDQPVIGKSVPPTSLATSDIGYFRFHGRNYRDWFREGAGRDDRYNYLYSDKELDEWVDRVRDLENQTKKNFLIYNNHYGGKAVVNALQMKAKLTGKPVPAPRTVVEAFPEELKDVTIPDDSGRQLSLF